jgi:CheB methylesterase
MEDGGWRIEGRGVINILVQHLDPQHESALTQLLSRATPLHVVEVTDNLRVEANHIYVIPPNANLDIAHGVLKLRPRERTRMATRSIDSFLESLAQDQRERAIGVILSGTASDGTLGLEAIKAEGGITFAQDDSAKYDSMPLSAAAAGCVDFIFSPGNIAKELARLAKHLTSPAVPPRHLLRKKTGKTWMRRAVIRRCPSAAIAASVWRQRTGARFPALRRAGMKWPARANKTATKKSSFSSETIPGWIFPSIKPAPSTGA